MEHVINAKSRNQAFWKFIFFFIFTVVIIVTAVYFDYDVPYKENIMLRGKINDYENQSYKQKQFIASMETAKKLIDSMTKAGEYNALIDQEIATCLEKLRHPEYLDSSVYASINKDVFIMLDDYYSLNAKYMKSDDVRQKVDSLIDELNQLQQKYDRAEQSLDIYRRSGNLN